MSDFLPEKLTFSNDFHANQQEVVFRMEVMHVYHRSEEYELSRHSV
jgi:hypothetical protein